MKVSEFRTKKCKYPTEDETLKIILSSCENKIANDRFWLSLAKDCPLEKVRIDLKHVSITSIMSLKIKRSMKMVCSSEAV